MAPQALCSDCRCVGGEDAKITKMSRLHVDLLSVTVLGYCTVKSCHHS